MERRFVASGDAASPSPHQPAGRIQIENLYPEVDCGRHPAKRIQGETFEVWADIFRDGHDVLGAALLHCAPGADIWSRIPMRHHDNDRWVGQVALGRVGRHAYCIEAWTDRFESFRREFLAKRDAGAELGNELLEGRALLVAALGQAPRPCRRGLERALACFDAASPAGRAALLLDAGLREAMAEAGLVADRTRHPRVLELVVDRPAARFAAWYEMFPRSQGTDPARSATFEDCIRRLPEIEAMGFDVLYFVPIHPIGRINRKGRNNAVAAEPGDPGSPYAIGAAEGGHTAIHPDLGTLADFRRLVAAAADRGLEVALDFATQCAPDHPWLREHPDWFTFRPDGTVKYAENPPKKYQDIVNPDFYGPDAAGLWRALKEVLLFWIAAGVRTFRVDNPHTKPVPFWEWLIREIQAEHPDVVFLAEAFTRPKMMKALAKVGFTQSYSYFTWRNAKQELTDYLVELTQTECREYLRPNFFTNTPDILPPILQSGGRPAFQMRLVLAATLSSVYGIYNGFELCEADAIPGTEEYRNSEKYEYKVWDWDRPGNIKDYVARLNRARRENPALQEFLNLRFYACSSDRILFYGKMTADRSNMVFVAVNLDPAAAHEGTIELPLDVMGIGPEEEYRVDNLMTGDRWAWRGPRHALRLDPATDPAALLRVSRRAAGGDG